MIKEKYMRFIILNLFFIIIFSIPNLGYAYIGPGLGAGTIGVVIGIIASIFLEFPYKVFQHSWSSDHKYKYHYYH